MAKRDKGATVDLGLRVKEPLRNLIDRAAQANGVSMNAEIVKRLERSFRSEQRNLLFSIVNATIGGKEPKWITPEDGRENKFTPEIKALMTARIAGFIASLPEAKATQRLTQAEFDAINEMLTRHEQKVGDQKKGSK